MPGGMNVPLPLPVSAMLAHAAAEQLLKPSSEACRPSGRGGG
jgi:hypothetical protein